MTGQSVADIESPALVVDLDALDRNIARMADYARGHGMRLRPHAKTHKSAAVALLQFKAGAVGVCVQKLSEAEALAAAGVPAVYISNEVIARTKLARVAHLASQVTLAIAVDSAAGIERLADAMRRHAGGASIEVFVEIDVGQGRCGALPDDAAELAQLVVAQAGAGLRWAGLQAYHGKAQHLRTPEERAAAIGRSAEHVRIALSCLEAAGIDCPLVTGGGTGSFANEATSGVWNELQPGSYVFIDRDYGDNQPADGAPRFEHALFVKSQVISRSAGHAVVDAGHKSYALDSGPPAVWGRPLRWENGGDEHGILRGTPLPELGDTVWLVPGHCDPTVNLHDRFVGVRGGLENGVVEAVWPVDARGCVR